jgi:RNA polymerase sigma factor (sigma-70 family)
MIEYNKDMTRLHSKISKKQQQVLWDRIQNGDIDARDEVIYSCLPMVVDIAKKFRVNNKHIDLEDFVQEGNIALMSAVDNWDVNRASITTVATWYIRNSLIDMIHDAKYKIKNPLSMSRRASEELSKIKRCIADKVDDIASKTNLGEKRIKKLLSVDSKKRLTPDEVEFDLFFEEEENKKPCLADLLYLANDNLQDIEQDIFIRWSGLKGKRQGVKSISQELNITRKETMSYLSSAKRTLRKKAKQDFNNA